MIAFGLDIGTTTCCCAALDGDSGALLAARTLPNDSALRASDPRIRLQNPERIVGLAEQLLKEAESEVGAPDCIGLSGQMHGIVYVDRSGRAASPLYSWQDLRAIATMPGEAESYLEIARRESGEAGLSAGDGLCIHFVNLRQGLAPDAAGFCTIQDYVAMRLAHRSAPITHRSDAASFGLFDLAAGNYNFDAARAIGAGPDLLPRILDDYEIVGRTPSGVPVCVPLGDNQASFAGAVRDAEHSLCVNIGTGGQVSRICDEICAGPLVQTRPYLDGQFLWAGLTLASGRSYAALERLFRGVVRMATGTEPPSLYDAMTREGLAWEDLDPLRVCAQITGTRANPAGRASIEAISESNFTAGGLICGFVQGIVDELFEMYASMQAQNAFEPRALVGSGNGIRRGELMRRRVEQTFGAPLRIPLHREEAACGAALQALCSTGAYAGIAEAQAACVRYLEEERPWN